MTAPLLSGFASGLALIIAIGAQNSFVLRQGIRRQHRLSIAALCAFADALLILAGIAGLGALIAGRPGLLAVTRYGGAVFLFAYAGLAALRAWRGQQLSPSATPELSRRAALALCLGFTFLNPHVYLDTVLLLGALANQHAGNGRWLFGAGATLASVLWFFALAYGASLLAPVFRKVVAWRVLDGGIALIMTGLAIGLLAG
jgi:L-lysine exporter family protein LysE/ArgO